MKIDLLLLATILTKKIPDPTKAKGLYKLFWKKKGEKIRKASKAVKKPTNGDIKSVTVWLLKTVSNLLNPITQSNIITQELETAEKPNILDIESVTIEHPKAVT